MLKQLQAKLNFDSIYFYSFILFAFTLPLSRASISFFIVFIPLVWFFEGNLQQKIKSIQSNKFLIALFLYVFYLTLSLLWTQDLNLGLYKLRLSLYFLTIYVAYTALKPEYIEKITTAFLLGMFTSEIISYGIFFQLWTFNGKSPSDPVPFMHHIDYSVLLAITSMLLLNKILSKLYNYKEKIVFLLFFFSVTGNLFLIGGRTGQVALIGGIIITVFLHYKVSIKSFFLTLFIFSTIFISAFNLSNTFHQKVLQTFSSINKISSMNFNSSIGIRAAYAIVTYNIFLNHPLGVGVGDYKEAITQELEIPGKYSLLPENITFMKTHHPHSQYNLILIQLGFIGILLFIYLIYQLLKLKIQDQEIKNFSIIFTVVYFTSCLTEPLFIKQFPLALFVLFASLFVASTKAPKKASNEV